LSTNNGSLESLKPSVRCGFSSNARQIRPIVDDDSPLRCAIFDRDQPRSCHRPGRFWSMPDLRVMVPRSSLGRRGLEGGQWRWCSSSRLGSRVMSRTRSVRAWSQRCWRSEEPRNCRRGGCLEADDHDGRPTTKEAERQGGRQRSKPEGCCPGGGCDQGASPLFTGMPSLGRPLAGLSVRLFSIQR